MGKYKYLLKNVGLLTLSQFATKLMSFFLVPLYTNVLTTSDYGTYDLLMTTVGLLVPILTLNIQDSVLRFSLDENANKNAIVSVSVRYFLLSNIFVVAGLMVNSFLGISCFVTEYSGFIFLLFFSQSLSGIVTTFIRGTGRIADLSISSVLASACVISLNLIFLLVLKGGITGYFFANILGACVQNIYLLIRSDFCSHIKGDKFHSESKAMTAYSKPLIANSISWWINNVSDRYVVTLFCGLAENGIYSVAGKIPSILNIFQSIFSQAWTLSVVKDFDREDKSGFFTNTYKSYNCMMVIICSGIILFNKFLARILYAKDFYLAWKYVPWLTIAIVFGALAGYLGGFFTAAKESKIFSWSTMIGAATNLFLNLILTPLAGALGAAIATMISYAVVWAVRYCKSKKYIILRINIVRDLISYLVVIFQAIILMIEASASIPLQFLCFIFICILYFTEIKSIITKLRSKLL